MKGLLILILFTVALVGGCVLSSPQFPEEYSLDDVEIKYDVYAANYYQEHTLIYGNGTTLFIHNSKGGEKFAVKKAQLSKEEINSIIKTFKDNNFLSLQNYYGCFPLSRKNLSVRGKSQKLQVCPTDLPTVNFYFKIGNISKEIGVYGYFAAQELKNIGRVLDNTTAKLGTFDDYDVDFCLSLPKEFGSSDCIVSLAVKNNNVTICNHIENENNKNYCIMALAAKNNDAAMCSYTENENAKNNCKKNMCHLIENEIEADRCKANILLEKLPENSILKNHSLDNLILSFHTDNVQAGHGKVNLLIYGNNFTHYIYTNDLRSYVYKTTLKKTNSSLVELIYYYVSGLENDKFFDDNKTRSGDCRLYVYFKLDDIEKNSTACYPFSPPEDNWVFSMIESLWYRMPRTTEMPPNSVNINTCLELPPIHFIRENCITAVAIIKSDASVCDSITGDEARHANCVKSAA